MTSHGLLGRFTLSKFKQTQHHVRSRIRLREAIQSPSFRGDAKHRTRNLEIPGLRLAAHPGMTESELARHCAPHKDRHCERSEAIHRAAQRKNGLLRGACHRARIRATRWLAMTLNSKHTFATSRRDAPEALMNLPPKEGVGNAGCPLHPRPRVGIGRTHTSNNEYPGITRRSRTQ